jgi:hypothetical protein
MEVKQLGSLDSNMRLKIAYPHGSNGSISMTATLILYDYSGYKLIED